MALESVFKRQLIEELQDLYPGAIILRNNANTIQGIPDQIILFEDRWAAFDTKKSRHSPYRPNQPYYIKLMNKMSYASFVYPENKERFLDELQQTLRPNRRTRLSVR